MAASILEPGRNCWRIAHAKRAALVVDAADYFRLVRKAILNARSQILLIGWDLDTRIRLDRNAQDGAPEHLGPLISWVAKHRPGVNIHMLAWGGGAYRFLGRGSTLFRIVRWRANSQIHFRLDANHPGEASHHQKIVVIDDTLAFCGGIDITGSRWDTRAHRDDEPGRKRPTTRRRYFPWHDMTMAVDAPAAEALGDLGRNRWKACTGETLPKPDKGHDIWPEELEVGFKDIEVGISRTRGKVGELEEVREIEALFVDMIARARRFIYAENQYFASRVIAEAITKRLQEPDCPEIVLICPRTGEGFLDDEVMSAARHELLETMRGCPHFDRLRLYTPVTKGGEDIYVHAKLMIVDDAMIRVGSANMNNRSMGLDSECDLIIDSALTPDPEVRERIASIRADLMAEHLGCELDSVERAFDETGSLIATIERLRGEGRSLRPLAEDEPDILGKSVAKSEIADPESAKDDFEPLARNKLLGGLKRLRRRRG